MEALSLIGDLGLNVVDEKEVARCREMFTLYDEDFRRVNPKARRHDDERRAFVAYPDGSRCWVHRPFDTSDPNGSRCSCVRV